MSEIKEQVQKFIHKYLDVHPEAEAAIADYALRTWQPRPKEVKYLQFIGNPATGKTRAGAVMAAICRNPLKADGSTSPASLAYLMGKEPPCTLILDEAYTHNDPNSELTKILNIGGRDGNYILKMVPEGERLSAKGFDVFGYKVLMTVRKFRDPAIQSRCITVTLTGTERNDIPRFLNGEFEKDSAEIRQALNAFYADVPDFAL